MKINIKRIICKITSKHRSFIPGDKPGDITVRRTSKSWSESTKFRCEHCKQLV